MNDSLHVIGVLSKCIGGLSSLIVGTPHLKVGNSQQVSWNLLLSQVAEMAFMDIEIPFCSSVNQLLPPP